MNHLLHLPLRKQSLCALRCLFLKLNGELGHSSAFLGLQMPRSKRKSSLSETTPTAKRAHTFGAFAEVPSTMCRSREARQKRASMLVSIYVRNCKECSSGDVEDVCHWMLCWPAYCETTPGRRSEPVSWFSRTVPLEANCICSIYGMHQVFHFKPS